MTLNPFVALAEDPVRFFAVLGYALMLLTLAILSTVYVARTVGYLKVRWQKNRHSDAWFDIAGVNCIPPGGYILRLASVPAVLMLTAWAVGALIWLAVPG